MDRQAGILRGVKVLGFDSTNGRYYTPECVKEAMHLYEGAPVSIDHRKDEKDDRPAAAVFGYLRNVRLKADGLYGDLHFMRKHPMAQQICEAGERMPHVYGLSHDANGEGEWKDGTFVVHRISEVRSVDLVADPATTRGLFESKRSISKRKGVTVMKLGAFLESARLPSVYRRTTKRLMEMGYMDPDTEMKEEDMPDGVSLDAPADEVASASPDDALWSGFRAAINAVIDDPGMDASSKHKKIGKLLKAHEGLTADDAPVPGMDDDMGDMGDDDTMTEGEDAEMHDEPDGDEEKLTEGDDMGDDEMEKKDMPEGHCKESKKKKSAKSGKSVNLAEARLKAQESALELCEKHGVAPGTAVVKAIAALGTEAEKLALLESLKSGKRQTPRTQVPGSKGLPEIKTPEDFAAALLK